MIFRHCRALKIFLLLAGFVYVAAIVIAGLSAKPLPSDLAVVLGNEVLADGTPSKRLKARLDCARDLYRRHFAPRILVSGGQGKSGYDEATVMAEYLMAQGVSKEDILIDSKGVNTEATAINTSRIAVERHFRRILIVSQYYHLPRCIFAFKRAGLDMLSADYPRYFELSDLFATLREAVALPVYFIKMPGKEFVR